MKEEIKGEGFTIIDKRQRTEDQSEESSDKASEKAEVKDKVEGTLPQVDFSSFIFSLSTSALIHFGAIPDPITKKTEKNIVMARQTIDLLGILKDKTKGNLTKEEEELLTNILYDLRMIYVKESK
ncbi:MAG: DUF1844 domain-containing protein [Nitrospirota bacterium]|jgi:hypothetical protein